MERLCDDLAALVPTLVKPVVDVAWFSWQLWRLTGRRGAAILYAYVALGYASLRWVGRGWRRCGRVGEREGRRRAMHRFTVYVGVGVGWGASGGRGAEWERGRDGVAILYARHPTHCSWAQGGGPDFGRLLTREYVIQPHPTPPHPLPSPTHHARHCRCLAVTPNFGLLLKQEYALVPPPPPPPRPITPLEAGR